MKETTKDEQALADLEEAKQLASRCKSFNDVSTILVEGIFNKMPKRVLYWAILYYGLVSNDQAAYHMIQKEQPELTKELNDLIQAQAKQNRATSKSIEQPSGQYATTPPETANCLKVALDIGRRAESEADIFAAIPQDRTDAVKTKTMVWASLCYCFLKAKPELYNDIKREFPELVSEFEYWCENILIAAEESEPNETRLSLAELQDSGFDIDTEMIETVREFSRVSFGKGWTIH